MSFISQTSLFEDGRVVLREATCDSSLQVGDWVRIDPSTGFLIKAIADSRDNSEVIGIIEEKPASTLANVLVCGLSKSVFTGLTLNRQYYLSDMVLGQMTLNVTVSSGSIITPVARAVTADRLLVNIGQRLVRA